MLQVGAGFWLTDQALLRARAEELARAQYALRKNPADAALMYMALGKKLLLQVGGALSSMLAWCCCCFNGLTLTMLLHN